MSHPQNYARWALRGEDLKDLRLISRLTQRQLAERMGVTNSRVAAMEAAKKVTRQGLLRYMSALVALLTVADRSGLTGTYGRKPKRGPLAELDYKAMHGQALHNLENKVWHQWGIEQGYEERRSIGHPAPNTRANWPEYQEKWVSPAVHAQRKERERLRGLEEADKRLEQMMVEERLERVRQDPLGMFMADCLRRRPEARTSDKVIWDTWEAWAATLPEVITEPRQLGQQLFAFALPKAGFRCIRGTSEMIWIGVEVHGRGERDYSFAPPVRVEQERLWTPADIKLPGR
jgi:transcriptional regulator with XRE-family HTH domain